MLQGNHLEAGYVCFLRIHGLSLMIMKYFWTWKTECEKYVLVMACIDLLSY